MQAGERDIITFSENDGTKSLLITLQVAGIDNNIPTFSKLSYSPHLYLHQYDLLSQIIQRPTNQRRGPSAGISY